MIKNMTVGKKITLGFIAVLTLLSVVAFTGYHSLQRASDGFTAYREMARDTNLIGRLQANMLMVRMNVKDFLITGSDQDLEQYGHYWKKMVKFQAEAQEQIQDPDRAARIDAVETALGAYGPAFAKVVEYKRHRNHLVNDVLNVKGPFMENSLTDIMVSAHDDSDLTASYGSPIDSSSAHMA